MQGPYIPHTEATSNMCDPRSSRRYSQWDSRSAYPQDRRFINDNDFNSAAGLHNMSRREREEVWRRAQARVNDPYSMPCQRSGAYATMGNIHAVEDARGRRRRNTGVDEVANQMSRTNMGNCGSRGRRSGYNVHWVDQFAAPEPPRTHPRNAEYYLDRACRPRNTWCHNYNDANQYMNGRNPGRRTAPADGRRDRHDPRTYAGLNLRSGLNGDRNRDPTTSRWDRMRNWF
ncbi:uncharacterized protein M421DRAFT_234330 [Didymella exigua CBS 183.55]|uniref:Uncharacterized protein n=1 Tax=Didymella exigua CBS 183.55 TaxID=1150837 RepID=A0A6A5RE15_9PLEO|nr:uncharacterized protein M421DRAFT_234330 [Didymella exigua CBS 183.55]KAF1925639.1 hypothetical protein M421DRAFT_234330 [Didymella exigua CBS 183.55]